MEAAPWGLVLVGGPLILLLALLWARMRSGKSARRSDPDTPPDDPSKGI